MKLEELKSKGFDNSTIAEALAEHGIQIDSTPTVIDVVPTGKTDDETGEEWVMIFFIAKVKIENSNSTLSELQRKLKNWGTSNQTLRAMEAIPANIVEEMGLVRGAKLENATFRVIDSLVDPSNGDFKAKPRQTRDERVLVDEESNSPVFRTTQICDVEELAEKGHEVIRCRPVVAGDTPSTAPSTTKEEVLQS